MERRRIHSFFVLVCLVSLSPSGTFAQSAADIRAPDSSAAGRAQPAAQPVPISFRGDAAFVSKYLWRGQRLTNDWSLQPAFTISSSGLSFNVWSSLDLTAVNEGDSLPLGANPGAQAGRSSGLKGKFSEVDYTVSYSRSISKLSLTGGAVIYTFPERAARLNTTTELFGGIAITAPLKPSATLYVDVDESSANGATTASYLRLSAGHSVPVNHRVVQSLDLSASLGIAGGGFGDYYYGAKESGLHDLNLAVTVPLAISERWSCSAFIAFSSLLGDFRDLQYPDLRDVYRGRTEPGKADSVWGGVSVTLAF